jgi:hypothetical protein
MDEQSVISLQRTLGFVFFFLPLTSPDSYAAVQEYSMELYLAPLGSWREWMISDTVHQGQMNQL